MDLEDRLVVILIGAVIALLGILFAATYYDTAAQRQCKEKLATVSGHSRSAAEIAQLCK